MVYYEDLLGLPFRLNGRFCEGMDCDGLDCYGACIELCRRDGKTLTDLNCVHVSEAMFLEDVGKVNVEEIAGSDATAGDIVQCWWEGELHIAYMLDKKSVFHATLNGMRVTPITALKNKKYFRVV